MNSNKHKQKNRKNRRLAKTAISILFSTILLGTILVFTIDSDTEPSSEIGQGNNGQTIKVTLNPTSVQQDDTTTDSTAEKLKKTPNNWAYAVSASQTTDWHPLLIMSLWQMETAHFSSPLYIQNQNFGGLVWDSSSVYPKGSAIPNEDNAWYIDFPDIETSFEAWVEEHPQFKSVTKHTTPEAQAQELLDAGYAASPEQIAHVLTVLIDKNRETFGESY